MAASRTGVPCDGVMAPRRWCLLIPEDATHDPCHTCTAPQPVHNPTSLHRSAAQEYELPSNVVATTSAAAACAGAQYAIHAVPVQHSRAFLQGIRVRAACARPGCGRVGKPTLSDGLGCGGPARCLQARCARMH